MSWILLLKKIKAFFITQTKEIITSNPEYSYQCFYTSQKIFNIINFHEEAFFSSLVGNIIQEYLFLIDCLFE